ncbi:hypothetical protein B0T21DRAFT_344694 [Apiosordaria backusii]|uniref:Uncharacterized protein n=1 Tax=Apiosordaria backusii TaxID=314023 RepID=A0AA40K3N5_9PEZI|nr:hypothetical protein B0T21DRAFT_344694 [Apiosordaria backusii]
MLRRGEIGIEILVVREYLLCPAPGAFDIHQAATALDSFGKRFGTLVGLLSCLCYHSVFLKEVRLQLTAGGLMSSNNNSNNNNSNNNNSNNKNNNNNNNNAADASSPPPPLPAPRLAGAAGPARRRRGQDAGGCGRIEYGLTEVYCRMATCGCLRRWRVALRREAALLAAIAAIERFNLGGR